MTGAYIIWGRLLHSNVGSKHNG